ncbi:MAG: ribosome small subunit-dependent GTPase A [Acidobacteria bacterium]|nr:ribosome small subunit-dependent GTPase A [Acidobacteriota bacterium]
MNLSHLGWDGHWTALITDFPDVFSAYQPFRILADYGQTFLISDGVQEDILNRPPRWDGVVGDWILVPPASSPTSPIRLPRRNQLGRQNSDHTQVLAANLNWIGLMTSANRDFNLSRLERMILLCQNQDIQPIIILNKIDLSADNAFIKELETWFPHRNHFVISVKTGDGLDKFEKWIAHQGTGMLLGSSGVGKSSLTNRLLGQTVQATQNTQANDRGRHETTHRHLFPLPNGSCLIDAPGIRLVPLNTDSALDPLSLWGREAGFACRFSDCSHLTEPGCGYTALFQQHPEMRKRWEKRLREQHHYLDQDPLGRQRKKAEDKILHRAIRQSQKFRKK